MVILTQKRKSLKSGFFFVKNIFLAFFFVTFSYAQEVDKELLEKYVIDIAIRDKFQKNSFYLVGCEFCNEFKVELFKAGINVDEVVNENQYKISVNFNSLSAGLNVIRGWNGSITNSEGRIMAVFNVEKKKVIINPRRDYTERKNCMLHISNEIFKNIVLN